MFSVISVRMQGCFAACFVSCLVFSGATSAQPEPAAANPLDNYEVILVSDFDQNLMANAQARTALNNAYNHFASKAFDKRLHTAFASAYKAANLKREILVKDRATILIANPSFSQRQVGTIFKKWEVTTTIWFLDFQTSKTVAKQEAVARHADWGQAFSDGLTECFDGFLAKHVGFEYLKSQAYRNSLALGSPRSELVEKLASNPSPHPLEGAWRIENPTVFGQFEVFLVRTKAPNGEEVLAAWVSDPLYSGRAPRKLVFSLPIEAKDGVHNGLYSEENLTITYPAKIRIIDGKMHIEIGDIVWGTLPRLVLSQFLRPAALEKNQEKKSEKPEDSAKAHASESQESSGSGFLVSRLGVVATNYHVIAGAQTITVIFPGDTKRYSASPLATDKRNDLALLRVEEFPSASYATVRIPYRIRGTQTLQISQKVFTIGYPLRTFLGSKPKYSDGTISSITGPLDDPRLIQMSASIQPGNSGGPLFNSLGEIVGVVVASANAKFFYEELGVMPQNLNFAVKSDYLLSLLYSEKIKADQEFAEKTSELSVEDFSEVVLRYCPIILAKQLVTPP